MKTVLAPQKFNQEKRPFVFLAGSIEMGKASLWQDYVIQKLEMFEGTILNPRRTSWDVSWEQSIHNEKFKEQVDWELDGIEQSDIILFYFDPHTLSPITLMEYGLSIGLGKQILVACPKPFWRKENRMNANE
jgi:nucleoside 2-deoxyribosyltransferase